MLAICWQGFGKGFGQVLVGFGKALALLRGFGKGFEGSHRVLIMSNK